MTPSVGLTAGPLRLEPMYDTALVDAVAGVLLHHTFVTYGDSPYQGFSLIHEPELRPGRTGMRLRDHPGYRPDNHLPPKYSPDPDEEVLLWSPRRALIFEWEFCWLAWQGDVLPMSLFLKPGLKEASARLAATLPAADAQETLAALIDGAFRTYRPPIAYKPSFCTQLLADARDAAMFGRTASTGEVDARREVVVAEAEWLSQAQHLTPGLP